MWGHQPSTPRHSISDKQAQVKPEVQLKSEIWKKLYALVNRVLNAAVSSLNIG